MNAMDTKLKRTQNVQLQCGIAHVGASENQQQRMRLTQEIFQNGGKIFNYD